MDYMMKDRDDIHPPKDFKAVLLPSSMHYLFFIDPQIYSMQVIYQTVLPYYN